MVSVVTMVLTIYSFPGEASKLGIACHEVVEEYHDYLVAVDKAVFALGITDDASDTVGIGVGCHYEVGTYFFCLCDGHCHCGRLFGGLATLRWGSRLMVHPALGRGLCW